MEVLIGAACFSALGYYSYLMYNYFKARNDSSSLRYTPVTNIDCWFSWYYVHTCIIILCES